MEWEAAGHTASSQSGIRENSTLGWVVSPQCTLPVTHTLPPARLRILKGPYINQDATAGDQVNLWAKGKSTPP